MTPIGRRLRVPMLWAAFAVALGGCAAESADVVGPDTRPPVVTRSSPTGALPSGTTSTTLTVVTDEPASCRYGAADAAYGSLPAAFADAGATHTATLSGLADGQAYVFWVRCLDAAGNANASGFRAGFRVANAGAPVILWRDDIQGTSASMGFDGFGVEHPIGTVVTPADRNGANLSRVPDPLGGGWAMRHYGAFDAGGARSQAGLYGDVNAIFGAQARSPEGVWVAQEWYFPEPISAGSDPYCWMSVWDWHSIDAGTRGNRWHTSPGLLVARDGSMRVQLVWGGPAADVNGGEGPTSTIAMPVGRWFDIEMHYEWVDTPTGTIQVWIDGQLAIEQQNVQTRASSHAVPETYMKFYGSTQGAHGPWVPTPTLKYTRNVRVAGERIWR